MVLEHISNNTKSEATSCIDSKHIEEDKRDVTSKVKGEQMRKLFYEAMTSKQLGKLMDSAKDVERTLHLCEWWNEKAKDSKMVALQEK